MSDIANHFNGLDDPRHGQCVPSQVLRPDDDRPFVRPFAGARRRLNMADFAQSKEDFLREFLELPAGLPCHDTFSRVFRLMEPIAFEAFFAKISYRFAADRDAQNTPPAIAIDGKEMRRSFDRVAGKSNMNIVTAFAHGARLTLGIAESAKGGGEISALRDLIKMLDIRGITITRRRLHCQRETCELIVEEGVIIASG